MKLLKVEDGCGLFVTASLDYEQLDKINKEDVLRLVGLVLDEKHDVDFDAYDESILKHQAHRVIYRNISQKLIDLRARRKEFIDESATTYLEEYERYRNPQGPSANG